MDEYDVIVVGQGYAGLTAAKLAAARGFRVLNIEQSCMGGLIMNINELYPAPEGADHVGSELASGLAMANMDAGIDMPTESVTSVERAGNVWLVSADSGSTYKGRHVIVASGAKLRKLGVPGEEEFFGRGVSECADCDGPMFRGMETVVVGGGDSAFQEAAALAEHASRVTVIMRGSAPRARQEFIDRVAANPKIVQVFQTEVAAIEGPPGGGVEAVQLRSADRSESRLATKGVFIFIGLEPNTQFVPASVEKDEIGALNANPNGRTNAESLWVVGAARSGFGGLLTDADEDAQRTANALQ